VLFVEEKLTLLATCGRQIEHVLVYYGPVDPFSPAMLGPVRLRNRIIKSATFEGRSPHRVVTPALIDFHRTMAAGGVGLSTVAYCAVSVDGSTDGHQIVLTEDALEGLRGLTDAIHDNGAAASAQLGHAGPVANIRGVPAVAPSAVLTPWLRRTRALSEDGIARVIDDFGRGARIAIRAGFDAIEVHMGHNYLLSAFLSPRLNARRDRWGGDLENRARLPRQVARAVREAAPSAAIIAKLNISDGVPGGLDIEESLAVAAMLADDGTIDALELTVGSSLANPMYLFRGDVPLREFRATLPPLMRVGFAVAGRLLFKEYPIEEAFLRPLARRYLAATSLPVILLGGINRLDTIRAALDEGFSFVALGRALLREPDLVERMRTGAAAAGTCIHCNRCMPTIYSETRCTVPLSATR
jgi:2,4-dienoyl-CoA reductase-like NADH-dependent reductase (Old Yellow Enzyme family)